MVKKKVRRFKSNDDVYGASFLVARNLVDGKHHASLVGNLFDATWKALIISLIVLGIFLISLATLNYPVHQPTMAETMSESLEVLPLKVEPVVFEEEEESENEKIEEALVLQSEKIENCKVTFYCSCSKCCGQYADGITASGTKASAVTCAVDRRVIPMGATVMIDYDHDGLIDDYRIAEDTGAFKGNHIDLFVPEGHQRALELGVKSADIYWVLEN